MMLNKMRVGDYSRLLPPLLSVRAFSHRARDFLTVDDDVTELVTPQHQACTHPKSTDCGMTIHIDLWRFDFVFLQARLERGQIETAVVGAKSVL